MRLSTNEMIKIKSYFFKEGVCLVEDRTEDPHPDLGINSKEVMKMFKSLVSKGIARKTFVWRHAYYFITQAGIEMLKDEFCLEEEEFPLTHIDSTHPSRMEQVENVLAKADN